jgi:hypothetical protein
MALTFHIRSGHFHNRLKHWHSRTGLGSCACLAFILLEGVLLCCWQFPLALLPLPRSELNHDRALLSERSASCRKPGLLPRSAQMAPEVMLWSLMRRHHALEPHA